jgi:hypothetical protein
MTDELLKPFYRILTSPPHQWHAPTVHFPIVFLFLEAAVLGLYVVTRKPDYERWAYAFLHMAFWTMLGVAALGLHDAALDLGAGNKFWLGLQDRLKNSFDFDTPLTVHVWLALALVAITAIRLCWRTFGKASVLRGAQALGYGLLTLIGLWILSAAAYVGGSMSHG